MSETESAVFVKLKRFCVVCGKITFFGFGEKPSFYCSKFCRANGRDQMHRKAHTYALFKAAQREMARADLEASEKKVE